MSDNTFNPADWIKKQNAVLRCLGSFGHGFGMFSTPFLLQPGIDQENRHQKTDISKLTHLT